ncbi:hypothetical protein [Sphingomonas sp. OK281]|uniref:hypothetical protein n=1 Tax=Sphingomonas sp. OK281 TaxID=1881067 RepID=UPI0008F45408|nr:hypothetical protein [Sphingomonas sp. OK281]SFO25421.1 hypothetical protein SAMN05428984_2975 [Sphingomonas sp. OK281]
MPYRDEGAILTPRYAELSASANAGRLASHGSAWQDGAMADPTSRDTLPPHKDPSAAGGFLVALGMLGGAGLGFAIGQATPGFLIGTGVGVLAAVLVWLKDRR